MKRITCHLRFVVWGSLLAMCTKSSKKKIKFFVLPGRRQARGSTASPPHLDLRTSLGINFSSYVVEESGRGRSRKIPIVSAMLQRKEKSTLSGLQHSTETSSVFYSPNSVYTVGVLAVRLMPDEGCAGSRPRHGHALSYWYLLHSVTRTFAPLQPNTSQGPLLR